MIALRDIDFLIIGAAKSATTWLQRALQADPMVHMPDPELHYFSREHARGDGWYLGQFHPPGADVTIGEKSNSYMEAPEAAERIHAALPQARLIAQLRDPVARAYSDYCMLYRRGDVGADIARHLDPRCAAQERFIANGHYCEQLLPYIERYGAERLLVLLYEDVRSDPAAQLERARSFLGLGAAANAPPSGRVKDRTAPVVPPQLRRVLTGFKPWVAPLRGSPVFERLRGLVAREPAYPPLSPALRARLAEHYAPGIERLQSLVGSDLSRWLEQAEAGRKPA